MGDEAQLVNILQVVRTVHYLWCREKKTFRFQDYLGVLSALHMLQPLKLVFHYTSMPATDLYNSWFQVSTHCARDGSQELLVPGQ